MGVLCSCSGGAGVSGGFFLVEFLESGKDSLPRNRVLSFTFSAPVAPVQDFAERLKIENVQTNPNSNFSRALGTYFVNGEKVLFTPKLPEKDDRTDAGFRPNASYHVFVKGGSADALRSAAGGIIPQPQEFLFDTSEFFEDPLPSDPPRTLGVLARDPTTGNTFDVSRLDAEASVQALLDSDTLIQAGNIIEPGAGGGPNYATPWQFDLLLSEPIDPATVNTRNVEMFEIRDDALTGPDVADPGHFGTPVDFRVPIRVRAIQRPNKEGEFEFTVRVTPIQTLVDDARYRIIFSGGVLGLDFRKTFIGENGLTGGAPEPGGLGYTTEFLVYDRPGISATRTLTYDPLLDGIRPEQGQTSLDEKDLNTALYNPVSNPGRAVGFLGDFGTGADGPLSVAGSTVTIDTGDTPNALIGNPFTVIDKNPNDDWNPTSLAGGPLTYDSPEYYELNLASLVISSGATLQVRGVNPILFRVTGVVQIGGTLDLSGEDGEDGSATRKADGGRGGAGGFDGGLAERGDQWSMSSSACQDWAAAIATATPSTVKTHGQYSHPGEGPGRGQPGGEAWTYAYDNTNGGLTGTGGGGASHLTPGTAGEDRGNASGAPGTAGPQCAAGSSVPGSAAWIRNSSIIGVRGQPGPTYGDLAGFDITLGGSGGGAGGSQHQYNTTWGGTEKPSGGAGGGGGGSLAIYAAGPISGTGMIDASGGGGGKGTLANTYSFNPTWMQATGGGGGGSGGTIVLISADHLDLTGMTVDARGGAGGLRADVGTTVTTCNRCNRGGNGGKGLIFMMDSDGIVAGFVPTLPDTYPGYGNGFLVISEFTGDRFGGSDAITELFPMSAANPTYLPLSSTDIKANVNAGQEIIIRVSSAQSQADDPLAPDLLSEIAPFEVARASFAAGGTAITITGNMADLNVPGPGREVFVRVRAQFDYDNIVEAALGPFASIDEVALSYSFNG